MQDFVPEMARRLATCCGLLTLLLDAPSRQTEGTLPQHVIDTPSSSGMLPLDRWKPPSPGTMMR